MKIFNSKELTMQDVVKQTKKCLSEIIAGTDYSVYDVEYVKEGPNWYLRIYIDKENGVNIDDCEFVSRKLEKLLDERDFIKQAYILEVSSPGINRRLKQAADFAKYRGHIVDVKLYKPVNGLKEYQGELKGLENEGFTIILPDGKEAAFSLTDGLCTGTRCRDNANSRCRR